MRKGISDRDNNKFDRITHKLFGMKLSCLFTNGWSVKKLLYIQIIYKK